MSRQFHLVWLKDGSWGRGQRRGHGWRTGSWLKDKVVAEGQAGNWSRWQWLLRSLLAGAMVSCVSRGGIHKTLRTVKLFMQQGRWVVY